MDPTEWIRGTVMERTGRGHSLPMYVLGVDLTTHGPHLASITIATCLTQLGHLTITSPHSMLRTNVGLSWMASHRRCIYGQLVVEWTSAYVTGIAG